MKKAKKSGGRPARHAGERLSKNRTFRVRGQLDEQLADAAARAGRSVSEEIEYRLDRSFVDGQMLVSAAEIAFGSDAAGLVMVIGDVMRTTAQSAADELKRENGHEGWTEDPEVYDQVAKAVAEVFEQHSPRGGTVAASSHSSKPLPEDFAKGIAIKRMSALKNGQSK
jgi:hypothetical protein